MLQKKIKKLKIDGEIHVDSLHRILYSTDASAYREMPLGVACPKNVSDIRTLIDFASHNHISLIPRAAGTSLAGQVVGNGLVVDISRYLNKIIEINVDEHWIKVEPGVVLDELNMFCKPYGLFFGPETSTANRCCIGGMVGNNSCGSHSLIYGSTRDHLLEAKVMLFDGTEILLKGLSEEEVKKKCELPTIEGRIYKQLINLLSNKHNQEAIYANYPDPEVKRRNSGYAIDKLLNSSCFHTAKDEPFNLCDLLAGSEGTLAFITELKLNLVPLPPSEKALVCIHCSTLNEAFEANLVALKHNPVAIELMDHNILELSKKNLSQSANRFFIKGNPAAILMVELAEETREQLDTKASNIEKDMHTHCYGYHFPRIYGKDINKVWSLRKAGLGLLSGMSGDAKPVSVIEDTAVAPYRLPAYMSDFKKMLDKYHLDCVYHAHISTGELHLRPILNLKEEHDRKLFRTVAEETAMLVKKHRGSLSGEHGDGRLRGEFLPILYGNEVYGLFKKIKRIWDPEKLFNPGKIVDTPPMDDCLRYVNKKLDIQTYFDYGSQKKWLTAIEQCNGSGDCRKSELFAGTMCPTFRATRNEKNVTRARANILRELLITDQNKVIFNHPDILEVLDTCISCKACKSECPSNIDMTRFKAEYYQHHYEISRAPMRSLLIANITKIQQIGSFFPCVYNFFISNHFFSNILKRTLRFASQRDLPRLSNITLRKWHKSFIKKNGEIKEPIAVVYLFADEFTNYVDVEIGKTFILLLYKLGYSVIIPKHTESGRTELSKGFLKKARKIAEKNIALLSEELENDSVFVGIEPSCILSFRDEYLSLVSDDLKENAKKISEKCLLYDEFIVREINRGNITKKQFTDVEAYILLHGHCHQKTLASIEPSQIMLSLPQNYHVNIVPSGCCGMAGSFGFEKEHYSLSMHIGENTLFPTIRKADSKTIISAPGTSCRQQITDGTGRKAYHPIEILFSALL
ncbi:FAD-binding and (Fe-S)-binding domain-containing protein [Bacteroides sp. 519]|uniref:FAD-binding and (Fe-S)-binding domain-containing protein n=1 Tax=Bacteroides sp. 519 TaxID=2302937 RepID=UPI0013D1450D|nr:FAD-binding and (Fe-S)-binding domain-containing protein [Bacteroides sp. 519]NDV58988.1 FAD-binding oxidoreductase [Bacteroides sp. 519]